MRHRASDAVHIRARLARVSLARALALVVLVACRDVARAEVILSTDDVAVASSDDAGPSMRGYSLSDMIAKHVAFPREVRRARTSTCA